MKFINWVMRNYGPVGLLGHFLALPVLGYLIICAVDQDVRRKAGAWGIFILTVELAIIIGLDLVAWQRSRRAERSVDHES